MLNSAGAGPAYETSDSAAGPLDVSDLDTATTCYQHPEREAGVRCQRCDRVICQECMRMSSVGFHCPECVAEDIRRVPRVYRLQEPPYLAYALIALNIGVALAGILENSGWFGGQLGRIGVNFALLGGGLTFERGGFGVIGVDGGEWYRIITGAFLHSGPIHLGFNMFLLWQLGLMLEPVLGRPRFGLLYLVSLLGGSFGALLMAPDTFTVGASGAVFGLMGAVFLMERARGISAMQSSVGFLIVINLVLTFAIPGISIGGHVGGLLAGAATGWWFHQASERRIEGMLPDAIVACFALVLFAASLWAASLWDSPLF
ncbi:MAG: rhomboid family intramembrane serine protease [Dehalococcoidia bacterium]